MTDVKAIKHVTVLLLVNKYGEFLLGQRHADSFAAGYYELPGGKQEANESLLETVKREIYEETTYKLADARLIYETPVAYHFGTIPLHVFYAKLAKNALSEAVLANSKELERPNLLANEAAKLIWVKPEAALKLPLLPILRRMLDTEAFRSVLAPFGKVDLSVDEAIKL